jgi:hypothetical protein
MEWHLPLGTYKVVFIEWAVIIIRHSPIMCHMPLSTDSTELWIISRVIAEDLDFRLRQTIGEGPG